MIPMSGRGKRARRTHAHAQVSGVFSSPERFPWRALGPVVLILAFTGCTHDSGAPLAFDAPAFQGTVGRPMDGWVNGIERLEVAPDGNLFVQTFFGEIRTFTPSGDQIESFPAPFELSAVTSDRVIGLEPYEPHVVILDHHGAPVLDFTFEAAQAVDFPYDFDITASDDGTLYVVDSALRRVQRFAPDGTREAVWGTRGTDPDQMERPTSVALDPDGNVVILDSDLWRVQKFTPDGRLLQVWDISRTVQFDARLYGSVVVDAVGRPVVGDFSFSPGRVTIFPVGRGEVISWLLPEPPPGCDPLTGLAISGDEILVASLSGVITRFSDSGEVLGTVLHLYGTEPGEVLSVDGLAALPDNRFVVLDQDAWRLEIFDPTGLSLSRVTLPDIPSWLNLLAATPGGTFWVGSSDPQFPIFEVDLSGALLHQWTVPTASGRREYLTDLEVDGAGHVVLLVNQDAIDPSMRGVRVEVRNPDGTSHRVFDLVSRLPGQFFAGVAVDSRDNAWLLESSGPLHRLDLTTGTLDTFADWLEPAPPTNKSYGYLNVAVGPGDVLYVIDATHHQVVMVEPHGTTRAAFGQDELSFLGERYSYRPYIAVSPSGVVWISGPEVAVIFAP